MHDEAGYHEEIVADIARIQSLDETECPHDEANLCISIASPAFMVSKQNAQQQSHCLSWCNERL